MKNILIGNGFGLSHPELGDAFKWSAQEALSDKVSITPQDSTGCAEKYLDEIRRNYSKKILTYYIDNLKEKLEIPKNDQWIHYLYVKYTYDNKLKHISCKEFLSGRTNIFTLNYDPILYFEVLKLLPPSEIPKFIDGFKGDEWLKQDEITSRLRTNTRDKGGTAKIFYLHGAYFIQADDECRLQKLAFGHESEESILSLSADVDNKRPYLILEDRWRTKKGFLTTDEHPYYKYCYKQLKNIEGKLLVFGCSFKNDRHIWHAIQKAIEDGNLTKVYITYVDEKDKDNVDKLISEEWEKCERQANSSIADFLEFIHIEENVIWETNE